MPVASYIDAQLAPAGTYEGSLYLARYSSDGYNGAASGLYRIEFNNPAYDNSRYKRFGQATTALKTGRGAPAWAQGNFTLPAGYHSVSFFDLQGRLVWTYSRPTADLTAHLALPMALGKGIWQARLNP